MGLDQVIGEVRRDGDARAQATLAQARKEADAILAAARKQAEVYEQSRLEAADRDSAGVKAQAASRAESEARKAVLTTEAQLRDSLREQVLAHMAKLSAKQREPHVKALLETAKGVIPSGQVWGAEADAAALKAQKTFAHAGNHTFSGGLIVESEDGKSRLDLSYETLLETMWRDVLKSESALFR